MLLGVRPERKRLRSSISFTLSGTLHASALAWVMIGPVLTRAPANLYDQEIRPHQEKIIWYSLKDPLPDISPAERVLAKRPPRARTKSSQELVAGARELARAPQLIWTPAPAIDQQRVLPSPNLVVLGPPARPQSRAFAPPQESRSEPAPPVLASAPELTVATDNSRAALNALPPLQAARRTFIPPVEAAHAPVPEPASLPTAPAIRETASVTNPELLSMAKAVRPFRAPAADDPPAPPVPQPLTPPPAASTDKPPTPSLAIVSLFPSRSPEPVVPKQSQEAGFSAGPQPRLEGDTGAAPGQLSVPGLYARSSTADPARALLASLGPASRKDLTITAGASPAPHSQSPKETPQPGPLPSPPEGHFRDRLVYTIAIQMPNVTSYSGSWIVWFAERDPVTGEVAPNLKAPLPVRKVDPKYLPSAMEEKVEGRVRLAAVIRKDGHVDTVEVLRGVDMRLDRSAEEALAKWEFEPATRNGSPIEVDAVFEIPFRLAPKLPR